MTKKYFITKMLFIGLFFFNLFSYSQLTFCYDTSPNIWFTWIPNILMFIFLVINIIEIIDDAKGRA